MTDSDDLINELYTDVLSDRLRNIVVYKFTVYQKAVMNVISDHENGKTDIK